MDRVAGTSPRWRHFAGPCYTQPMRATAALTLLAAVLLLGPPAARAGELVVQFRSVEDPTGTPDLTVCAEAPFVANVVTAARLLAVRTRASDGRVLGEEELQIGTGTGCLRVTDPRFPPFTTGDIYGDFTIGGRTVRIDGVCTITSNDVPLAGVVLAGCATSVVDAPPGFVGGVASSNSVFNPFRLPGYSTGSFWTVRLYDGAAVGE